MTDSTLYDFVHFLSSSSPASRPECQPKENPQLEREKKKTQRERTFITFAEFRDFLLLLPRRASVAEIYKCKSIGRRHCGGSLAAL
jgi:solute carrier family 25 phosphate transporter 23/24/25/41